MVCVDLYWCDEVFEEFFCICMVLGEDLIFYFDVDLCVVFV